MSEIGAVFHVVVLAVLACLSPMGHYRHGIAHNNSTQTPTVIRPENYLPFFNLNIQWLFFVLVALGDMRFEVENNVLVRYILFGLDRILGVLFAGFVFPVSLMLPVYFCLTENNHLLYNPAIISQWIVYVFHFSFLPIALFEMVVTDHEIYHHRQYNLVLVLFSAVFNLTWMVHTCHLYKIFNYTSLLTLTIDQKLYAFLLSVIFSFVPYLFGELYYFLWWTIGGPGTFYLVL